MINDLIEYLRNKKILILGFGREGKSTYKFIRKYLNEQKLYISDKKKYTEIDEECLKNDEKVIFISGDGYLENLEEYDIIIKTPGISFVGIDTQKYKNKITSQLELLLEFFDNFTIGITGTKGKSTTSSLIYQTLKDQGKETLLLGNIGVPVFDYIDDIEKNMILVLEMSSHQLEFMQKSPDIAVITNLFPDHLDHYESFEKYAEAKCNIYKYQEEDDYLLYDFDNDNLKLFIKKNDSNVIKISLKGEKNSDIKLIGNNILYKGKILYDKNERRNLLGEYNLNNIMFVLGVSEILKLNINQTIKTISEFKSLPHRLQYVGTFDGISYYDNSIATIPNATIEAIKALENVDTLIIGGMDRGIDYTDFIDFLNRSKINNIICMPKTGHDIANKLKMEKIYIVDTMEDAVSTAKKVTKKNTKCLLSPAAASYGFFKNFEEKGDLFQKLIKLQSN